MASLLGRVTEGAVPLALLLAALERTGSLASAGTAAAALGAGFAAAAPVHGRVLDRLGARRVLPLVTAVHAGALVLVARSGVSVVLLALVAGATTPPLSALMRATWLCRVDDEQQRAFVLGVEAVAVEATFVLGPAAVSMLLLVATPGAALVVLAAVTVTGASGFAAACGDARPPGPRGGEALGPLRSPGLRTLLAATAAFGAADGIVQVAVVGATGERPAGLLLAVAAGGSVAGGLLYVRRRGQSDSAVDFSSAHLAMAAALVLASAVSRSQAGLAVVLLVHGVVGAPVPVANSRLLAHVTEQRQATEAGTWLVVAVVVGAAVGSGVGGWVVEQAGVTPALLAAAAAMASGGGIASVRRATLR